MKRAIKASPKDSRKLEQCTDLYISPITQGKYVKKDEAKANEYFTKAQQMNQGNLNGSRTSLMPSESDMIHSNYQRKANNRR